MLKIPALILHFIGDDLLGIEISAALTADRGWWRSRERDEHETVRIRFEQRRRTIPHGDSGPNRVIGDRGKQKRPARTDGRVDEGIEIVAQATDCLKHR